MTFSEKILKHYIHAVKKHPHFADRIITPTTINSAKYKLSEIRAQIAHESKDLKCVWAEDVMLCELWEVIDAYADGRHEDAIEEIYDSIAVLLRMAEMIEKEGNNR